MALALSIDKELLSEQFASDSPVARAAAVTTLASHGTSAAAYRGLAVQAAAALNDSSAAVRAASCWSLGKMGDAGLPFSEKVFQRLEDGSIEVCVEAALALGRIGHGKQLRGRVCEAMVRLLKTPNSAQLRAAAARSLAALDAEVARHTDAIIPLLADRNLDTRAAGLFALSACGIHASQAAEQVSKRTAEPMLRKKAFQLLGQMGETGAKYAGEIVKHLYDEDVEVRQAVIETLAMLKQHLVDQPSIPTYAAELLRHRVGKFRAAGAACLGMLGVEFSADFVDEIASLLKDDSGCEACEAIHNLVSQGLVSQPPVWMMKPNCAAAFALGKFGSKGAAYSWALAKRSASKSWEMRLACCQALGEMGEEGFQRVGDVADCLADNEPLVQVAAIQAIEKMRMASGFRESCIARLRACLLHSEDSVRQAAVAAFGNIGDASIAAELTPLLEDACIDVQVATLVALSELGAESSYASKVSEFFAVPSAGLRIAAATSAGMLGSQGAQHVVELCSLLSDPLPAVRCAACRALAKLATSGASGPGVMQHLQHATQDDVQSVASAAEEALKAIAA